MGRFLTYLVLMSCGLMSGKAVLAANVDLDSAEVERRLLEYRERPGALGLGLGLEVPVLGLQTGVGSESSPGFGYSLGVGLSWEFLEGLAVRLVVTSAATRGGQAAIRFLDEGVEKFVTQDADWLDFGVGGGLVALFRNTERSWSPFVGLEGAYSLRGYDYALSTEMIDTVAIPNTRSSSDEVKFDGLTLGWQATLRTGIRLDLLRWLAANFELAASYVPISAEAISRTRTARQVQSAPESLYLVRLLFSLWIGL